LRKKAFIYIIIKRSYHIDLPLYIILLLRMYNNKVSYLPFYHTVVFLVIGLISIHLNQTLIQRSDFHVYQFYLHLQQIF